MNTPAVSHILDVAIDAALSGGRRALGHFNTGVAVQHKADRSPVTIADHEAEQVIRERIARDFPTHAVLGEEQGATPGDNSTRWIIDPIDGTKSFICGVPLWGVLVGVEIASSADVGVVYLPALNELVWAARGLGCWWNGRRAKVSNTTNIDDAVVCVTNPLHALQRGEGWRRLAERARIQRGWGDCYGHVLVATGRADVMLDPAMNPWDCAPLLPIITEAGGTFSDWQGTVSIWGKDAVSTNARLHEQVLNTLRDDRRAEETG